MSEWREVQLRDIVSILGDGLHGTPEYSEDGSYCFVNGNNLNEGSITINQDTQKVSYSEYLKYKKELGDRTLLVSINGTLGNVAYYRGEKVILGKSACYFNLLDHVDKGFIRYVLSTPYFQKYIQTYANGTTIKNLSLKAMREFSFDLPPLQEQKEIANILSCLDRKISNLRQQNETLEKIAQTLFKHWFVDFEFPNEDGKPYKSSGGDMVRSELGEIPAGWQVGELGNIGKNIRDGISEDEIQPDMNYIALEHMPRKQIALDSWDTAADIASNKFIFKKGNILFGKLRPYFHKVGIAFISGICSTDILVLDSKRKDLFSFLLMVLSSDEFIKYVTLASEGTRMPRTSWEYMKEYPIYIPDNSVVSAFNDLVKASTNKIENNVFQIQTLTQIRDVLLPKLMSGKLRITAS